jgi:hypothetical protein
VNEYAVKVIYVTEAESEQDAIDQFREWIADPHVELEATELEEE